MGTHTIVDAASKVGLKFRGQCFDHNFSVLKSALSSSLLGKKNEYVHIIKSNITNKRSNASELSLTA
jgi:hypothetical protein